MIKRVMIVIILSLNLIGCNMNEKNNTVSLYKTKEYEAVEKNAKISIEKAIDIICKSSQYEPFLQHYLIYENKYIFTSLPPTHAGTLKLIGGLAVDVNTGEINIISKDTFIRQNIQVSQSLPVKCKTK